MGELIIHIDQESGAVTKIRQVLNYKDKELLQSSQENREAQKIFHNILALLHNFDAERAALNKSVDGEFDKWLHSTEQEHFDVDLPILGDIYNDNPKLVKLLKEFRDTFDRIVSVPVELWERAGNTVCTVKVGGVTRKCRHRS